MAAKYIVSSSPHISTPVTTKSMMLDVIIALIPAVIATIFLYGFYPLFLIILCVASCMGTEYLFNLATKRPQSVGDLSAVVTGIILGLNLPAVVPFYVPIIGGVFAILIVKMLFGGLGKNFANPAITARIFLMLCWTTVMTTFVAPIDLSDGANLFVYFKQGVSINLPDAITTATPLAMVKDSISEGTSPVNGYTAVDLLLGRIGGSAGEVCAIAILIGGIYLIVRRVVDWRIPLMYIGSTIVFTALFFCTSDYVGEYIWTYLLSGGLLFGAFFMATDYSTSPKKSVAVYIYGIALGLLTVVFRKYSSMNEGVSFAILLMNIVTPLLDMIKQKPFGAPKHKFGTLLKSKSDKLAKKGGQQ